MKKRAGLIVAAGLAVAGCASVGDTMNDKQPSAVFPSAKTPDEFRACLIGNQAGLPLSVVEWETGYLATNPSLPDQIIRVQAAPSGSEVTVWGMAGTRKTAENCR